MTKIDAQEEGIRALEQSTGTSTVDSASRSLLSSVASLSFSFL